MLRSDIINNYKSRSPRYMCFINCAVDELLMVGYVGVFGSGVRVLVPDITGTICALLVGE